ncbi:MAG: hypothetical protein PUP93_32920 [Rhizonema sp. NSF051]|nr:hypothetical protein [Rhizonema sp. NSF051]
MIFYDNERPKPTPRNCQNQNSFDITVVFFIGLGQIHRERVNFYPYIDEIAINLCRTEVEIGNFGVV